MIYKTWLFVPAAERFLSGRLDGLADVLVFDLEDSVRDGDKQAARERLCRALEREYGAEIFVRINAGAEGEMDLQALRSCRFDGLMLPKTEQAEAIEELALRAGDRKLIALVESLAGIVNLERIASLPCLYGIAFGGEDYCRELGVETNDLAMQYARGRVVLLARYYQKYCLDTISMEYRDREQFLRRFRAAAAMGFHSKLLIHPAQAEAIRAWEESNLDLNEMKRIVCRFEDSKDGLVEIDGRWYERPHIERLKKLIAQMEKKNEGREQPERTD